jgi:four helix bundle protein
MLLEKFFGNPIIKLTFDFSILIINFTELLEKDKKYVIANQLLKSGTSIGANCVEAQNAESKADFFHKIKIAAKEAEETQYWLLLCEYSKNYPTAVNELNKLEEINKVLGKIISTYTKNKKEQEIKPKLS